VTLIKTKQTPQPEETGGDAMQHCLHTHNFLIIMPPLSTENTDFVFNKSYAPRPFAYHIYLSISLKRFNHFLSDNPLNLISQSVMCRSLGFCHILLGIQEVKSIFMMLL
jgi:hypothetical protein